MAIRLLQNAYIKMERKDDTQIREAFQIFSNLKRQCSRTLAMLLICGMRQLILLSAGSSYFRRACCRIIAMLLISGMQLILQHGRGERDQMASTSVPPQAKAALLGTRF